MTNDGDSKWADIIPKVPHVRTATAPCHSHLLAWPLVVVVTGNEAECRSGFLNSFLPELLLSPNTRLLPSASAFLLVSPVCWATVCVPVVTELLIF